jgi:hypothetical protein
VSSLMLKEETELSDINIGYSKILAPPLSVASESESEEKAAALAGSLEIFG